MKNSEELLKMKKLLDEGCITKEEFEEAKRKLFLSEKMRKILIIIGVFLMFLIIIGSCNGQNAPDNAGTLQPNQTKVTNPVEPEEQIPDEFAGDCPVFVKAKVVDNIIGFPELHCNIENNSDKEIAAVKLHFVPKDVYGEEVNTLWSAQDGFYSDNTIAANSAKNLSWQLLEQQVKSGDVYVYSIYFSDGSEWGDREASENSIKKYGLKVVADK